MRIHFCIIFLFLFLIHTGYSQPCTTLGQNPGTAFPVCGTATFVQNTVPICGITPIPGPCGPAAGLTDKNPFWYRFTCYIGGTLGFLITPFNLADDYDWQLFDITGRNPADVYTDPTLFVACNWSGFGGITGASSTGFSLINCAGNVPIFSSMPTLIVDHDYLLLVSHFTDSQSGYTLAFTMGTPGGGTAGITDPANPIPEVTTASPNCDGTQITVRFNKTVKCNSLAPNGSDFIISPSGAIVSAVGNGCTSSFDLDSVTLILSAPLPPGNYTVAAANGADGNTLLDNCDRPIVVGDDATFTVNAPVPIPIGTVTPPPCAPSSVTITFADPILCNSIAANGSDFLVTGPSAVTVTSATAVNCNAAGETNSITIQFAGPILVGGAYLVQIATGTDGNTLLGNCSRQVAANNTTPFNVAPQTPIAMGAVNPPPCLPSSITLTFGEAIRCNSIAVNGSDFIITGPSPVTVISAAAVNCSPTGETFEVTIQFSAPITVSGTYQVQMATGSDGNTLNGNCSRTVAAGDVTSFTLAPQTPIAMGNITPPPCAPSSITITFADPVSCNSIAANGSDFVITGPSAVTVSSAAAVNCTNGETTGITIQFSSSILVTGTYTVQMATGSDGNTLTGQCGRIVTAGSTTQFTLPAQPAIAMGNITPPPCLPASVTITFADPVFCNTIAANGSDFVITGPSAVTISSATAVNCNANGEATGITIQFSSSILVTGTYTVQMAAGSDGNTLIGQCGRAVAAGSTTQFTLLAQPAIAMGNITPPPCLPTSLTITFADPVFCNSIAANGSDFMITGPSAVTISSATAVNCDANGQTTTITIQFAVPIVVTGTYQVQMAAGSDGNTLVGQCGRIVTAGSSTQFTLPAQPAIAMGNITPPPCIPPSITITFVDPVLCNSIAANGSDFMITGPSAVTISSATAVNCNANGETTSITIQFSSSILVPGTYTIQIVAGSDGNTLTGQCGRTVTAGSTAEFVLAPQPPVAMGSVPPPDCSPSSVTLNFTDNILCNSIAANGSDFIITGPAAVVIISATATCNANGETNSITLQFSAPIAVSGAYQVQMAMGSDGNTLIGNCNRQTVAGDLAPFTIPLAFPVPMDSIVPIACSATSLRLVFDAPIRCASVAGNGSDFIITGPGTVTIASASTCDAEGLTTEIDIQLSSPIVVGGTYQLQLTTGSDGNTILSDCNRATPAGSALSFVASDTVSAEFQYQIQYDCETDIINFSHDGQHNVNQWTWTVNGTAASTLQAFTQSFSASGQNQVQLVVSNGVCSDTYAATITLNNKVTVDFDIPESVCPEDTALFINKSTGPVTNWQWTFGNGNTSTLQSPPAQVYPLTGIETLYTVSLTGSNNNGCQATISKTITVLSACIIAVPTAFTPNNDGLNDYLYPLNAIKAENMDFKVFNRWGQLVFHSRDWRQKWDGRVNGIDQATNVYVWTLSYTHKDTRVKHSLKGTTTLIR